MQTKPIQEETFLSAYDTIKKYAGEARNSLNYVLKEKPSNNTTKKSELEKLDFLANYIDLLRETEFIYFSKNSEISISKNNQEVVGDLLSLDYEFQFIMFDAYKKNNDFKNKIDLALDYVPLLRKAFFREQKNVKKSNIPININPGYSIKRGDGGFNINPGYSIKRGDGAFLDNLMN